MKKRSLYSPGGAATGNVGTGEDDLKSFTLPANSLAYNGDYVEAYMRFTVANNANQKRLKIWVGGTAVFDTQPTGLAVSTAYAIWVHLVLLRTASNVQTGWLNYVANGGILVGVGIDLTKTDTADIIIKATGETNAASNNDVTQQFLIVKPGEHTV